jgi:5-methylcytosine-specific restriction endonuclease McrA
VANANSKPATREHSKVARIRFSRGLEKTISVDDFKTFKVTKEIIDEYVNEYWQKKYDFNKDGKWAKNIKQIGDKIYDWEHSKENEQVTKDCMEYYVDRIFNKNYKYEKFKELLEKKKCKYCGITEDMIEELISLNKINKKKLTRGWTLEIDRKEPNLEYTPENCVRCCYWCNSAKTDEFDDEEFVPIGQAIKKIWHDRLNS